LRHYDDYVEGDSKYKQLKQVAVELGRDLATEGELRLIIDKAIRDRYHDGGLAEAEFIGVMKEALNARRYWSARKASYPIRRRQEYKQDLQAHQFPDSEPGDSSKTTKDFEESNRTEI